MKIAINDKSMEKSETLNKSDVTGVPSNANDPKVDSGVQHDVQGSEKSGPAPSAGETAGYAGSDVTGGDLTAHQDAGAAMDASVAQRGAEQEMWAQQNAGEVAQQTVDLKPDASHPESGLPTNADGKENTGGANAMDDDTQKKTMNDDNLNDAGSAQSSSAPTSSVSDETPRAATENDERFLRAVAELENFKRQSARREQEARERASRNVIEDLLPVLDNFERALEAARTARDVEGVRMGIEFIAQQLRDALKGHGVESIESLGQKFDPLKHDALEEVVGSEQPEGTILSEAQRGYTYKGQVLRPSRVRVAGK